VVPSQTFPTQDGWMMIMCMKDKFWVRLCERIERPALARDPRYAGFAERLAHRAALVAELSAVFRTRPTAAWIERLRGQVPCAPVQTVSQALADPQVAARDMLVAVDHPRYGRLREVGCPIKIDDVQPRYRAGAALGADTDAVLREWLGAGGEEIDRLRRDGAI
jgi:crotonobetainyl-CoA:carnitine CoA-transferase CaiB-like acyl-CoA transferase